MSSALDQLLARFGSDRDLIEAVKRQKIVQGAESAAEAFVKAGELVGFGAGETIITQGAYDRTAFLLLAGKVDLTINGCALPYGREAGDIVGEVSAINPELSRTATVTASEPVAALRVEHDKLIDVGQENATVWYLLAVELSRKLEQRNRFIDTTNQVPLVFMISSSEALEVAEEIRLGIVKAKAADVVLWSDDEIFPPGSYPLEVLRDRVAVSDFGIAIAHPDDIRRSRGRQAAVPRDNVVYELGFFTSVLGRDRTLLLVPKDDKVDLPSDYKGLTPLTYAAPNDRVPVSTVLAPTVRQIVKTINRLKVRSKLEPAR
jgi:predicted nucleotide-binding protein